MMKQCLEILAAMAAKAIVQSNNTASHYWTYQPKAPEGIKSFEK